MAIKVTGKIIDHRLKMMINHLERTYPVDRDIHIRLLAKDNLRSSYSGKNIEGCVSLPDTGTVTMKIATNLIPGQRTVRWTMKTIAHEYCHILQKYRDNLSFERDSFIGNHDREREANLFAGQEYNRMIKETGLIDAP